MEPKDTAAATVATGSVETPGTEATTQATPAAREAQASPSTAQPMSREDRRRSIAAWLDQPDRPVASPQDSNAAALPDNGSPSDGQSKASQDLSQSTPEEESDAASAGEVDEDAGSQEAEPEPEKATPKGHWPKEAVERVRKLKDQKQQLKGRLESLEAEVRTLRTATQKPSTETKQPSQDVLGSETDATVIRSKAEEASNVVAWADDLLDTVADDPEHVGAALEAEGLKAPEGGWSVDAMRQTLRGIKTSARTVVQAAPKRLEHIQKEDQSLAAAISLAPDLENPESELSKRVAATLASRPFIKSQPDWPLLVTAAVVGIQVLQERQKAKATPTAAATTTKLVARAPRMPGAPKSSVVAPQASEVDALRERATRRGATREDRLAYVRAQLTQG